MKKLIIIPAILLLSGCVTAPNKPSEPVLKLSELNSGEGVGYSKKNFNIGEYSERMDVCYMTTATTTARAYVNSQQERYDSCMRTGGYELTQLNTSELSRRKKTIVETQKSIEEKIKGRDKRIEERTYSDEKTLDKENFNDNLFISDIRECARSASKIKTTQRITPIYSSNVTTSLFNSFFAGMATAKRLQEARRTALLGCMFDRGYILLKLPEEEKNRRIQLIKDANRK